ncbi:MAG: hypothetical protein ACOWWO_02820 [Peptococcaceae bacterium]
MTHTLHRMGTGESLKNDICVMAFPQKGINYDGSKAALQWFFREAKDAGAVNLGMVICGNMIAVPFEEVVAGVKDGRGAFVVFDDLARAIDFLKKVKEKDTGISVTVSALWDLVENICAEVGVKAHSVNRSLGVWGDLTKLPGEEVRSLTSMCGHAQVSSLLVEKVLADIKKGSISPREGALKLAKPCICGFFNPTRAEKILAELTKEPKE